MTNKCLNFQMYFFFPFQFMKIEIHMRSHNEKLDSWNWTTFIQKDLSFNFDRTE